MASFEQIGLITQIVQNVYGLIANMRDNANSYQSQAAANTNYASIAAVMQADASAYLVRIGWITALANRNVTVFTAALNIFGLTIQDMTSLKTTLTAVCNHTLAATLDSQAAIDAEAAYILANVPAFERLW